MRPSKSKWVTRAPESFVTLKCQFHTRVIVSADRTPSGTRYDFQPGGVREDVLEQDKEYLLSLIYRQSACCGNQPGGPINYFTEV